MKISVLRVGTDLLIGKKHDIITNYLAKQFLGMGVVLNNVITIQNNPENVINALQFVKDDVVFIIGEATSGKNYAIKKAFTQHINVALEKNNDSVICVNNFYKQLNQPVPTESQNEYFIPKGATHIFSNETHMLGFVFNNDKTYIFLPDNLAFVKNVFIKQIKPELFKDSQENFNTILIKTFGIYEKDIYATLSDLVINPYKILFITYPNELEVTLIVRYNKSLNSEIVHSFTSKVFERLHKYIYADEDISLANRVSQYLKISNKTLAVAEAVSGGTIASTLIKENPENNSFLKLAVVCPNPESKAKVINVNKSIISRYGEVSIETAYEMAAGLLEVSEANYVICTTGVLHSFSPNDKKTTYIAVGNLDGIHVYKNTFVGNADTVAENITQTSLFYLIKNIKQNDLIFGETTI